MGDAEPLGAGLFWVQYDQGPMDFGVLRPQN